MAIRCFFIGGGVGINLYLACVVLLVLLLQYGLVQWVLCFGTSGVEPGAAQQRRAEIKILMLDEDAVEHLSPIIVYFFCTHAGKRIKEVF